MNTISLAPANALTSRAAERRNHDFGNADRQRSHGGGGDRCTAAAAHADDAIQPTTVVQVAHDGGEAIRHRPHRQVFVVTRVQGIERATTGCRRPRRV